jgi:ABC-type oligopeptide transport system substrate-binding subunit
MMLRSLTYLFAFVLWLVAGGNAAAAEYDFLSMHGTSKYAGRNAPHLDYANPDAPKGGTLRQAAIGTFDSLNPYAIKGKPAQGMQYVHDRLMTRIWDEAFTLAPSIAQRVTVPDDRSAITFHLDPRAKFSDGSPITADDVIFSFEILRESGRPNMRRVYQLVKNVERRDDHTVHFELGDGHDRETIMILGLMPVLSKAWWSGRTFDSATLDIPVSSGPYTIASVDPGRRIVYKRNPNYWAADLTANRGHYNFDTLIFDYYRDDGVAFEAFKSGQLDLRREWDAAKWAKGYDIPAVKNGQIVTETLPHNRPERVNSLIFNTRRPPFDDVRVRKALALSFDFNWVNLNLFHGLYKRVDSYFPNSELAARGEPSAEERAVLEPYRNHLPESVFAPLRPLPTADSPAALRENMIEADRLLKDAGWIIKNGQRVHHETGRPLTFDLILGAPQDEKIALAFARGLKKLGVQVNVRVLDAAAFLGRLGNYDYDMVLYFWLSTLSPGTEQILYWGCAAADQPSRWNYAGICNPAIDALADSIARTHNRDDLVTRMRALDRALLAGHYMIPLHYPGVDFVARRAQIRRPDVTPIYGMVLESWWLAP